MDTNYGSFTIEVDFKEAPKHSENFIKLVKEGFYNGITFHEIVGGMLVVGGDPFTKDDEPYNDGWGGPGYTLKPEIGRLRHFKGSVAAVQVKDGANPDKNSNGSQFYICLDRIKIRDGNNTIFGKVTENIDVINKMSWANVDFNNTPKKPIIIVKAYLK